MRTGKDGKPIRDMGTGSLFQHKGCKRWVIQYYRDGRRIREATGLTSRRKAQDRLTERLGQVNRGEAIPRERRPARIEELYKALEEHTSVNRPKSLKDLRGRWRHLSPVFGFVLARNLSTDAVTSYARLRQEEGAANATVNRELATLRRMFNLARRSSPPKVREVPYIALLDENNTRLGFVENAEFDRMAAEAAREPWLRVFLELAFTYGWRHGELLGLRVRHLNFPARTIRLDPGTTKNGEGREVTMTARVFELLRAAVEGKGPEDAVFTRENGKPVADTRGAWRQMCARAGLGRFVCRACGQKVPGGGKCGNKLPDGKTCGARRPAYRGLIPHDMRRSAAKALRAAGVPESVIMDTGGWRTPSMFRRYAIVSSADQRAAVEMLERARAEKAVSPNSALIAVESPQPGAVSAKAKVQ